MLRTKVLMSSTEKWYKDGLKFSCTQCGNCCSGAPGYVWVTREEMAKIAEFLGSENGRLGKEHVRRVGFKRSLTEKAGGDCIFLRRDGGEPWCAIYGVRPVQCRTWPFWSENVRSEGTWNSVADNCPGMNTGKLYTLETIQELRLKRSR